MNGASIRTPCSSSSATSSSSRSTTASAGCSDSRPATGSASSPRSSPPSATAIPPPSSISRRAQAAMLASSAPTTTMLCASCATVDANAPLRRPKPRTSPTPTRPVAWWRSITASFARSRPGSATTRPSRTRRLARCAAIVISWPGTISITRTRSPGGAEVERVAARAARRSRCRAPSPAPAGPRTAAPRRRAPPRRRPRSRPTARNDSRSSSSAMSAWNPGAIAPSSASPWQRAGCSVAITSASSGAIPSRHRLAAHRVDVALAHEHVRLAVVGAERAVLGPVAPDQLEQRAQVARVGGLAQQHPEAATALLQRLLPGRRLVVGADPGGGVGVERAAGDARARDRRRAGAARPSRARPDRPR